MRGRLLVLLLVLWTSQASAQAVVRGRVLTADSLPIASARVELADSAARVRLFAITDSAGAFRIRIPRDDTGSGVYLLSAEMLGFQSIARMPVSLADRDELDVVFRMDPAVVLLQPLVVTARKSYVPGLLDEYYDRAARIKRTGLGYVVEYEQLQKRGALRVAHVLAEVPGLRYVLIGARGRQIESVAGRGGCMPTIYLDGMRADAEMMSTILPSTLEGIEVYRGAGEAPGQYMDRSGCAVILLWSQRGNREGGSPLTWRRIFIAAGVLAVGFLLIGR